MARLTKQPPQPRIPPSPRVPLPPPDSALQQRGWAAFTLGLLSVIGLLFLGDLRRGVYVIAVSAAFGVLAIWLGVTASRRARQGRVARPRGAATGVVFGGLGFVLSVVCLVAFAVFWPQLKAYSSCLASANTVAAQQTCQNQFSKSISDEIDHLKSR